MNDIKTIKTVFDFDATVQGLKELIKHREEQAHWSGVSGATLLKEFRTVGVHMPRQCGKSYGAVKLLLANEKAILITINEDFRKHVSGAHERAFNEKLQPSVLARIYTATEVVNAIRTVKNGQQDILLENANEIIVDDSHYMFTELIKSNRFYNWLDKRGNPDQVIILL
ncbi:hypothetical protein D3C80_1532080 [compost metagenome]